MALKYTLLVFVAVLGIKSEAKVIPTDFFTGQELYALAEKGRNTRQCFEDNFLEVSAFGEKIFGQLGECGDDIKKLALETLEKISLITKDTFVRIDALLEELDACNDDVPCLTDVSFELFGEVIEVYVLAFFISAGTFNQVLEDFPESVVCVENIYHVNAEAMRAIADHFMECFVL